MAWDNQNNTSTPRNNSDDSNNWSNVLDDEGSGSWGGGAMKRISGNFNEFTSSFSAQPKDIVWLRYDLGGYVVESNKIVIGIKDKAVFKFTHTCSLYSPLYTKETITVDVNFTNVKIKIHHIFTLRLPHTKKICLNYPLMLKK